MKHIPRLLICLFLLSQFNCAIRKNWQFRNALQDRVKSGAPFALSDIYTDPWTSVIIVRTTDSVPFDASCDIYRKNLGFDLDYQDIERISFYFANGRNLVGRVAWGIDRSNPLPFFPACQSQNPELPELSEYSRSEAVFKTRNGFAFPKCNVLVNSTYIPEPGVNTCAGG